MEKTIKYYGYMSQNGNQALKGYCPTYNHGKSLPYTQEQLNLEGEAVRTFFRNAYNKVLKLLEKKSIKLFWLILVELSKLVVSWGAAAVIKNPQAIIKA